jgi:drug/metabolite transporter (DMT)-like permease
VYGFSVNLISQRLAGVSEVAITVGSLFFPTLYLFPIALTQLPPNIPTGNVWYAVAALAIGCAGMAYILFYRLITRVGAHRALTVTFLVPVFSMLWGWMFLGEKLTPVILGACAMVLAGVALTTGWVNRRKGLLQ